MLFSPFICGSLHHQEAEDDMEELYMMSPSPRRSSRKSIGLSCRSKESKNPYSDRGLDKFSALVADLDHKRQKIYTQKGSEDISFVRFAYSNSNDAQPIVVKVRDRKKERNNGGKYEKGSKQLTRNQSEVSANVVPQPQPKSGSDQNSRKKQKICSSMKMDDWRRPSCYFLAIIVLILILLAFFGRSTVILCTSIGWYMIPIVGGRKSSSSRKPPISNKKKEYTRRASDVKVVASENGGVSSPRSVKTGVDDMSPRQHGHQRSW